MKLSEIILLAKAGYSRKEIQALSQNEKGSIVSEPEAEQKAEETPNESSESVEVIADSVESEEAETESVSDSVSSVLPNILKRIEALEGQRYSEAIRNAEMPAEESPEEAIIKFLEGGL